MFGERPDDAGFNLPMIVLALIAATLVVAVSFDRTLPAASEIDRAPKR